MQRPQRIRYRQKARAHPRALRRLRAEGLGPDLVEPFDGIDPNPP